MRFSSHDEIQDLIDSEFSDLEAELNETIDSLTTQLAAAEAESSNFEALYIEAQDAYDDLVSWLNASHPDIMTTFKVLERMEK